MKLAVWLSAVNTESSYVKKNLSENEDLRGSAYADVDEEEGYGIAQIIDKAIQEYYDEKGQPVPQWKMKHDPDWWIEYLRELEEQ